jgi:hypothetical protein
MRHAMVAREDLSTIRDRSRKSLSEIISTVEIQLTASKQRPRAISIPGRAAKRTTHDRVSHRCGFRAGTKSEEGYAGADTSQIPFTRQGNLSRAKTTTGLYLAEVKNE